MPLRFALAAATFMASTKSTVSVPMFNTSADAIWLNPFFSGPFIVLGKVYLKKGDLANAESILKRALTMDVNNYSGHYLLAQVYQKAGREEDARKEFQTAERLRSDSPKP